MKKIGDVTSTADKNGEFTDGNVAAGTPPTQLMGDWFNSVQREIINVLIKAGVAQSKTKDDQLAEAIGKLIGSAGYQPDGYSYSKAESNIKFQPAGAYATTQALNYGLSKKFDKAGGELDGAITASWAVKAVTGNDKSNSVEFNFIQKVPILRITKDGNPFDIYFPSRSGRFMLANEFGIGDTASVKDADTIEQTSFIAADGDSTNFFATYAPALSMKRPGGSDGTGFITQIQGDGKTEIAFRQRERGGWRGWYKFLTEANTSKDANGFLRQGGATTLITNNVAQNTGTSTANVMSQKATTDAIAALKMMGDGQKWANVTSERKLGVNYVNTTGRAKAIFISSVESINSSSITVYSDNVICSRNIVGGGTEIGFTRQCNGYAIIPAGSVYRVEGSSLKEWVELV
ncbi:hypothetical protein [uncultured Providencia sp.]|uniref:hypothetical protein n=1 Tax=uncultured Providencia sp. TaxID=390517 RepID=UPI0030100913